MKKKKQRKQIPQILKKKKTIFFAFLILILLVFCAGFFYLKVFYKPSSQVRKSYQVPTSTPIPDWIEVSPDSLVRDTFYLELSDIGLKNYQNVSCLTRPNRIKEASLQEKFDKVVVSFVEQIENYEFSDEFDFSFEGTTKTMNSGKKSQKYISFDSFCFSEFGYYTLFSTRDKLSESKPAFINEVYAAGGLADPSHFAFVQKDGRNFFLLDKMRNFNSIDVPWGQSAVYFGCLRILGSNGKAVLLQCAGGDGPGGVSGLYRVNLDTKDMEKLAFCGNVDNEGIAQNEVKCFDYFGKEYYNEILLDYSRK